MSSITPESIKTELDKWIIGNDDAKKSLAIVAYNHYLRQYKNTDPTIPGTLPRLTCLISGPTGSGKSYLIEKLCEYLKYPFCTIDCTALTKAGFHGNSIMDYLYQYCYRYSGKSESDYINYGILYLDEFDKLGGRISTSSSDNWHREIQNSILRVIEGSELALEGGYKLDTRKMLIILAGAFKTVVKERKGTLGIGFLSCTTNPSIEKCLSREEMEKAGLIPEIVGRINVITQTKRLDKSQIKKLLSDVENNLLSQFKAYFSLSGSELKISEQEIDKIIEEVYNSPYCARHLKSILFDLFKERMYRRNGEEEQKLISSEKINDE